MALNTKLYEPLMEAAKAEIPGEFPNYAERLLTAITADKGKWWNNPNILHVCDYLRELKVPADEKKENVMGLLEKLRDADTSFNKAEGMYQQKNYDAAKETLEEALKLYVSIGLPEKSKALEHIKNLKYGIASAEKYARLQKKIK